MDEIKPCPRCGRKVKIQREKIPYVCWWEVVCENHCLRMSSAHIKKRVIKEWNNLVDKMLKCGVK